MSIENIFSLVWNDPSQGPLLDEITQQADYPGNVLAPEGDTFVSGFFEPEKTGSSPTKTEEAKTVFDDPSYIINVKVLDQGAAVLDAYEKSKPKDREIIFFCEKTDPAKSNMFGTFLLVKYGSQYRELISDLKQKKTRIASRRKNSQQAALIESYDDEITDNFNIIKGKYGVDADRDQVKSAMDSEWIVSDNSLKELDEIFDWYNDGVSKITESINGWLEDVKFKREHYQPSPQKPEASETVKSILEAGSAFLKPIEAFIGKTFHAAFDAIKYLAKKTLPKSWLAFLEKMYNRVQTILSFFKSGLEAMADLVGEVLLLGKALLMGFVNGLISTVQLLVSLIGWIFQNNSNKMINGDRWKQMNSAFEFIEDMFDLVANNVADFFDGIKTLWRDFSLEKINDAMSVFVGKISEYNKYDYAYFTGAFLFEVVLSVILAVFTGGAAAIAKAASMAEKLMASLKLAGREALSVATMGILDALQMIRMLLKNFISACKNGWASFKKFLKELLDDGAEGAVVRARRFREITREVMRQEMPQEFLAALKKLGMDEDEIIDKFTDYHNVQTNHGFLNDIDDLMEQYPNLSKAEIFAVSGYTTKYFYKNMNEWMRKGRNKYKTKQISAIINNALKKLPTHDGTVFRAIEIPQQQIVHYLEKHSVGKTVFSGDFLSCGTSLDASFANRPKVNVLLNIEAKATPIISDFADGIRYRGMAREELLVLSNKRFVVKDVTEVDGKFIITLKQK